MRQSVYIYKTYVVKCAIKFTFKAEKVSFACGFCQPPLNIPDSLISLFLLDKSKVSSELIVLSSSVYYHGLHLQCSEYACIFIVECRRSQNLNYVKFFQGNCKDQRNAAVHLKFMWISRFRCGVDLVYIVLACKKSFLGEALLFQLNLPLLKHFVDKNR